MLKKLYKSLLRTKEERRAAGVVVLYGGKSGNSVFVAKELGKQLKKNGIDASVKNLLNYRAVNLAKETLVLIVISTYGEGEPPPVAERFYKELHAGSFALSHLQYSVCALGDSSYEFFCQAGKDLDKRFRELGARAIFRQVDCDIDFRENAVLWITGVLHQLKNDVKTSVVEMKENMPAFYEGIIKNRYRLNKGGENGVYHLVLEVNSSRTKYQPGDTIGIIPENSDDLVKELLSHLESKWDYVILWDGKPYLAGELFRRKLEINRLSESVIQEYQLVVDDEMLSKLLSSREKLLQYINKSDLLDLLVDYPAKIRLEEIVSLLQPLRTRYYSIASSFKNTPGELHLTIKQVESIRNSRIRRGACSSLLTQCLEIGSSLRFRLVRNEEFRLPKLSGVPVIMIAAGAGIAPFRAFLQERSLRNDYDNWLIFGEKRVSRDFLYEDELKKWKKQGVLNRLDLAFSRDGNRRVYVQNRIEELQETFVDWLRRGACIYVCGSLQMGMEVRRTIRSICEKNTKKLGFELTPDRYMEDLY
ncbi:sulfite reductase flavoprotein subunit alpha [Prolixibacter sp. NT017]|uniref:diflavin oxidoreductase n=1 Tax=Prolixibacter sp. NT017 TaxID=2652390 RepID=UPI00127798C3|nr:flavodoxin domain-containing protein [Prolixibacter sp. NT017]GET24745.1 sulfite reductase [NADPH] flavoprotein alpha-component [Prolixibacter sp. NT017]